MRLYTEWHRGNRPKMQRRIDGSQPYQIPLSLPVIFWPTAAAVARQGNKLSRAVFFNSRLSKKVASCDA